MLEQLTAVERYTLVDDTWASVLAGNTAAADFLALAQGLRNEDDLDVWTLLCGCLEQVGRLLDGAAEARYQAVLRDLYTPDAGGGWAGRRDQTTPLALWSCGG